MSFTLGIIGCGKMAHAILSGLQIKREIDYSSLLFNDIEEQYADKFAQEFQGIKVSLDNLIKTSDIMILAVKPNQIDLIIKENQAHFHPGQLIISIAAGITTKHIEDILVKDLAVIRVMPNTPAMIGQGVTAITGGQFVTQDNLDMAQSLFNSVGSTYLVEEKNMDAITAISGSGPAYVTLIVEALINAGVLVGLDNSLAKKLVLDTFSGSIAMLEKSSQHPAQLREDICSPAGTTITALRTMEEKGLRSAIFAGVEQAFLRSIELGRK